METLTRKWLGWMRANRTKFTRAFDFWTWFVDWIACDVDGSMTAEERTRFHLAEKLLQLPREIEFIRQAGSRYTFFVGTSPSGVQWVSYEPEKTLAMIQSFTEQFGTGLSPVALLIFKLSRSSGTVPEKMP